MRFARAVRFFPVVVGFFGGVGLSSGCVTGGGGPAALAEVLARKPSGKVVSKSPRFVPAPLRAGQSVTYLVGENTASPFVYTLKVFEAGDLPYSFWFEEQVSSAESTLVVRSQFLMDESRVAVAGGRETFDAIITDYGRNVRTLVSTGGGSASELPRSETPPGLFALKTRPALFGGAETGKPRKASVRAAAFEGCYEATGTMTMEGREGLLSGCLDPQVPIHGLVEGRDPLGRRWELIDFAFSGAASAL